MPRVTHFEIHAGNTDRAIRFYEQVLGWQFQKWDGPMPYWLITTGPDSEPGINGGLVQRECEVDGKAVIAYVCTVDVNDVDTYVQKAAVGGGAVAMPKTAIPGVGWLAYCKDTEGNIFGLMQSDPKAA